MTDFLTVKGNKITDGRGRQVRLKGVNFGGWLMMEGYIMHARNIAVQVFKKDFARRLGEAALREFEEAFNNRFIEESDFAAVARLGANCIRLPFNYRLIESAPYEYDLGGVAYLDRAIRFAKKYGLKIILDLHAAPGAQNHDWHSDSLGKALLWPSLSNQKRTFALWQFLADRYKNETAVAGYDLLNEAVLGDAQKLNAFYRKLIKAIREVDRNHILFVEGNRWAMDLDCLEEFDDDNWAYSIHFYHPIEFTFNFIQHLNYPLRSKAGTFDKSTCKRLMKGYEAFGKRRPVFVGEFGVNARQGLYGEERWLTDVLSCFEERGLHWTYWTYKAVKHAMFPDGIFSYFPNDPWVNRQGPRSGWETYADLWTTHKRKIIDSWRTEHFSVNEPVVRALKTYFKR